MAKLNYSVSANIKVDEATLHRLIQCAGDEPCVFLETWKAITYFQAQELRDSVFSVSFEQLDKLVKLTEIPLDQFTASLHMKLKQILLDINSEVRRLAEGHPIADQAEEPYDITGIIQLINATPEHVSIFNHAGGLKATASADNMGTHWWIGRVLVEPEKARGAGVGGRLVRALIKAVVDQGGTEVWVTPGGYGGDPDKQFQFYRNHGFNSVRRKPELLIWKKTLD